MLLSLSQQSTRLAVDNYLHLYRQLYSSLWCKCGFVFASAQTEAAGVLQQRMLLHVATHTRQTEAIPATAL
jgi:hypothetical protein